MQWPYEVWFRLSPAGQNRGVSCGERGAFVGSVALLERMADNGQWRPRPPHELDAELSACFGLPVEVARKAEGLAAVARALNRDDLVLAQIATLHLQFLDPPPLAKAARSQGETIELARLLYRGELLKEDWDPAKHPRWPAGSPDGVGGEFAPAGGGEAAPPIIPAQMTVPAPFDMPFPGELPVPRPFEFIPPPLELPNTQEREGIPKNPYPDRPDCVKQWDEAKNYCMDLDDRGLLGEGDYSQMGKLLWQCMMGQVSEDCGGNSTGA